MSLAFPVLSIMTFRPTSNHDQRILIWANEGQADWHLAADSEESLERLVIAVWLCDQLEQSLWSDFEEANAVLRRLRESRRPVLKNRRFATSSGRRQPSTLKVITAAIFKATYLIDG